MSAKAEVLLIKKGTMYDLKRMLEKGPDKACTAEGLKALIDIYISGAEH